MNEVTYLVLDEANAEAHGLDALAIRAVTPVIKPWELSDLNGHIFKITPEALKTRDGAAFAGILHSTRHEVRHLNDEPVFPNYDGKDYVDPGADAIALKYVFADQLDGRAVIDEILEELLTRAAISCMYGDSNCGKTFLAIDIACAFARGIFWMGRNIEQGFVVYLATEAPGSVEMRVDAYQKHHGVQVPSLCIVQTPINLYVEGADTKLIIDLVRKIERERGQKCILIIGDTLSRIASGANENSGEDMNPVVDRLGYIRAELNAHILLIHHTGKNAALGMCGWSGVRAIIDTEIEVTEDAISGLRAAEVTKQRDIPGKGDRIGFRLQVVEMGIGKWGKPITSCVVVGSDAPPKTANKRPSEIAGAITELLTSRGSGTRRGELVDHFEDRYARSSIYKEIRKLIGERRIHEVVGVIGLASK